MLLAVSEATGIGSDSIPRIGTGFAGGVGLHGELCGALMGGVLIIGLKYGADVPDDEIKYACYAKTSKFVQAFKAANGSAHCRELIEIDLTVDDEFQSYKALNLKEEVCSGVVFKAVQEFMALITEWQ